MKKTSKVLVMLLLCFVLVSATFVPTFAASVAQAKNLKATEITYNAVTLTWTKASGVSGYEVLQNGKQIGKDLSASTTTYKVSGLATGTSYKFAIRAFKKSFFGKKTYASNSNTVTVKPMPGKVTGLKATVTYNSAKLTWTKVTGASGYKIEKYDTAKKKWVSVKNVTTNSYSISSLKLGTTYKYRVTTYRKSGSKYFYSAAVTVSVAPKLSVPTNFKASSLTLNTAKLSWTKVSGAAGYKLEIYNSSTKKWTTVKTGITTNTYSLSKLAPGTTYKYRLSAYRKEGSKTYYSNTTATVSVKTVVPVPTSLKASSIKTTSFTVSWTASKYAEGYQVGISADGGKTWTTINVTDTSYNFTGFKAGTDYTIRVRAKTTSNKVTYYSAYTSSIVKRTAPDKVTGLKTSKLGTASATLTWTKVTGATGYTVYSYNTETKAYTAIKSVTTNSIDLTGLEADATYSYAVAAYHNKNGSNLYGSKSALYTFRTYFAQIENLSVDMYASSVATPTAEITWQRIANAIGEGDFYSALTDTWNPITRMYTYSAYYSLDNNNTDVTITKNGNKVNVSWSSVNGADKYVVQTRSNGLDGSWVNEYETKTGTSADLYLAPSTQFEVRVIAYSGKVRIRCTKLTDSTAKTDYVTVTGVPGSVSNTAVVTTNAAPAFNASDDEVKTLYALMAVQAVNNTKAETSTVTLHSKNEISSELKSIGIYIPKDALGILVKWYGDEWHDYKSIGLLLEALGALGDSGTSVNPDDLEDSMNETTEFTGTFVNGRYVTPENTTKYLDRSISPSSSAAYLYQAYDVKNFSKKISNIEYKANSDGTTTIKLTVVAETADENNDSTPVHDGLAEGCSGIFGSSSLKGMSITMGETKITFVINKDGTLNKLECNSPFILNAEFVVDETDKNSAKFRSKMTGSSITTSEFTR